MNQKYKHMKTLKAGILKLFCLTTIIAFTNCETDETQDVVQFTNLVMAEEFDVDGAPDPTFWTYDLGDGSGTAAGPGWGNNELQTYTSNPENIKVENGVLVITALEESPNNYTSARLVSRGLFDQQYGRFEARIRLPFGKGIWPAFWLLGNDCDENPWPRCGEIDIMEYLGDEPTNVFGTIHGPLNVEGTPNYIISKDYEIMNDRFDNDFHIFGVNWGPDFINFYVDGDLYHSITPETIVEETFGLGDWVFNRPFYILLNVAVGGNLPGPPNEDTIFPQRMYVDYVRVYN